MRDERLWKAYDCLPDEGYSHLTVNHSLNFVDPAPTGAHTQRIGNTRRGIKGSIPRTGISKDLFGSYFQEWLWHKQYVEDPFGNIIEHIAEVYDVCVLVPVYATTEDESEHLMKKEK